jgi:archaellum component FlaC
MNESDKKIDDDIENLRNEMGNDFKRHDETKRRLEKLEQQVLITSIVADYGLRVVQNCQKTVSAGNKELEEAANGLYESGAKVDQQIEYKENVLHPMHEVIVNGKDPI